MAEMLTFEQIVTAATHVLVANKLPILAFVTSST
jgi:hypothetical protein